MVDRRAVAVAVEAQRAVGAGLVGVGGSVVVLAEVGLAMAVGSTSASPALRSRHNRPQTRRHPAHLTPARCHRTRRRKQSCNRLCRIAVVVVAMPAARVVMAAMAAMETAAPLVEATSVGHLSMAMGVGVRVGGALAVTVANAEELVAQAVRAAWVEQQAQKTQARRTLRGLLTGT